MLRKFKLVFVALAIILANQAVSFAVSAARPPTLLPAGSTRYAVVEPVGNVYPFGTEWANMYATSTSISIPTGKHGDVMVLFCAVASTPDFIEIRATIGGAVMSPSVSQILSAPGATESRCANFYKGGLPAGTRTVQMQSITGGGVPSVLFSRSMIVIVNVR